VQVLDCSSTCTGWYDISAGWEHSTAISDNKSLYTWGWNVDGQLGNGTRTDSHSPVQIGTNNWIKVSAGWKHTIALKDNDTLYAWGDNEYSQLGDGTTIDRLSPQQVGANISNIESFDAGGVHTAVLTLNGALWTWGSNFTGQLGDGTTTSQSIPVLITVISSLDNISAGWEHTVSIQEDGTLWTWGWNGYGQLGNGSTSNNPSPIALNEPFADFSGYPLSGDTPLTVNFTNNSGGLLHPFTYGWDFDNNGAYDSSLEDPSYIYTIPGEYSIKLSATDSDTNTNSLTKTNYVTVCYSPVNIPGDAEAYTDLQSAYNNALDTNTIEIRDITSTEDIYIDRDISININGGCDCLHSAETGITTIIGGMIINDGLIKINGGTVQLQ